MQQRLFVKNYQFFKRNVNGNFAASDIRAKICRWGNGSPPPLVRHSGGVLPMTNKRQCLRRQNFRGVGGRNKNNIFPIKKMKK